MKIITYSDSGRPGLGVVTDDAHFVPVRQLLPDLPEDLVQLLEIDGGLARLATAAQGVAGSRPLSEVTLKPLVGRANALWALALNFKTHIEETGLTTSRQHPHLFLRTAASYVGADEPILTPPEDLARAFDYEGELAVVIGRAGRRIPHEHALDYVAGYTCLNEGSVREYQHHNRQFGLGKNFEASGSYGPWLVTPDEVGNVDELWLRTRVNGVERQASLLSDMLFDVASTISYLSEAYTLRPGDLIAMGTPGALPPTQDDIRGRDLDRQFGTFKTPGLVHMLPGDIVEVEIDRIGILRNPVVATRLPD